MTGDRGSLDRWCELHGGAARGRKGSGGLSFDGWRLQPGWRAWVQAFMAARTFARRVLAEEHGHPEAVVVEHFRGNGRVLEYAGELSYVLPMHARPPDPPGYRFHQIM